MSEEAPAAGTAAALEDDSDRIVRSLSSLGDRLDCVHGASDVAQDLMRAIEVEILPRLMLAHRQPTARGAPGEGAGTGAGEPAVITEDERVRFISLLLSESAVAVSAFVDDLIARGVAVEVVFTDLLSTAARRLGELWDNDRLSFTDVTLGLCRLHEVLRHNSVVGDTSFHGGAGPGQKVLLATACNDQHVFGVLIVAEFFRRAGWQVWSEPGAGIRELCEIVGGEYFDVCGLSVSRTPAERELISEIAELRKASQNPALRILVGGQSFLTNPALVERVGADGCATSASSAPQTAHNLLDAARAGA